MASKFFFSGCSYTKLDEKNRCVIPQQMRLGLIEEGVLECTIALGLGRSLAIYRNSDIEKIVQRFQSKQYQAQYQKFFTFFFSTMHRISCDSVGRILIPPILKQAVEMGNEVVVAGVLDKIEIWPREVYDADFKSAMEEKEHRFNLAGMAQEAFALLEEGAVANQ